MRRESLGSRTFSEMNICILNTGAPTGALLAFGVVAGLGLAAGTCCAGSALAIGFGSAFGAGVGSTFGF